MFFHCSKQVLNSLILMPFTASAVFSFTSSTWVKYFPLRTFFLQGNKKELLGERSGEQGLGHGGHALFGQKLLNIQHGVGSHVHKLPTMKWEMC